MMVNNVFVFYITRGYWFHQSAAGGLPVARGNINVLAPEAPRTVVSVAVANHFPSTFFTGKIFFIPRKGRRSSLLYIIEQSCTI